MSLKQYLQEASVGKLDLHKVAKDISEDQIIELIKLHAVYHALDQTDDDEGDEITTTLDDEELASFVQDVSYETSKEIHNAIGNLKSSDFTSLIKKCRKNKEMSKNK